MTKLEAQELVAQVCRDNRRTKPDKLTIYQSRSHKYSSGHWRWWGLHTVRTHLHVTFGADGADHKEVLLHELAHHLTGKTKSGKRHHHSVKFWTTHYRLCDHYGVAAPDHARNVQYKAKAEDGLRKFTSTLA